MNTLDAYWSFVKERGRCLSEMNPGSDEFALTIDDSLQLLNLLLENDIAILGGEVVTETKKGSLKYAYHHWGAKYVYLDWCCDDIENETKDEYVKRSNKCAQQAILRAGDVAKKLKKSVT